MRWVLLVLLAGCISLDTPQGGIDEAVPDVRTPPEISGAHEVRHLQLTSFDGVGLALSVFTPGNVSAENPAPVILYSHGWGGSRATTIAAVERFLDAGYGVVTFDQRGFGETGGRSSVMDPDLEGQDLKAIVDFVAALPWVAMEEPGDPWLGSIGGSYGGGYQFMLGYVEMRDEGHTRLDAMVPEITWHNLVESLAPRGVVRSAWVAALYAAGLGIVDDEITEAFLYAYTTGRVPDGTVPGVINLHEKLRDHGPSGFLADGIGLDVPRLIRQGAPDTLFTLDQGLQNLPPPRSPAYNSSYFVSYNGGHVLPNLYPSAATSSGDPCSEPFGDWTDVRIAYFDHIFYGAPFDMPRIQYATVDGHCVVPNTTHQNFTADTFVATTGTVMHSELLRGPATIAGQSYYHGFLAATPDARSFLALSVGTFPDVATVGNQWMPDHTELIAPLVTGAIPLPAVATHIPAGQSLYLTVAGTVDQFAVHGNRVPGVSVHGPVFVQVPVQNA